MSSNENERPGWAAARELLAEAKYVIETGDADWTALDEAGRDTYRYLTAPLTDCIVDVIVAALAERIEDERLTDDTGEPQDVGYNAAIDDALRIVRPAARASS